MALVKRGTKGSPISAAEYDAVVEQVETNQEAVEVIQGQFVDSEVTLSFADLTAATAYWNLMDAASLTPSNNVEIYLQDVKQFYKWDSGETAKAVYSRDYFKKATEIASGNNDVAVSGDVADAIGEEVVARNLALALKLDKTEQKVNNSNLTKNVQFNFNSVFNGTTSTATLVTPITLSDEGDSIKFKMTPTSLDKSLGVIGELVTNTSTIGLFNSSGLKLYVRSSSGTFLTTNGIAQNANLDEEIELELIWQASDILVKLNGVEVNTITKGNVVLSNIGNSYNFYDGKCRDFTITKGVTVTKIPSPYFLTNQTDISLENKDGFLTEEEKQKLNSSSSETYYKLDVNGSSTGDELFTVYQKIRDNIYAGFDIHHVIDAGIQSNLWRIVECWGYTFDGVTMIKTSNELLTGGESEFVYRTNDAGGLPNGDFTGGIHGDEIQISAKFFASGVEITDITSDIPLTACNNFYYTNQTNTKAFGTTDNETLHDKLTFIENGGYRCFNRIKWLLIPNSIDRWYHGISCVGNDCGETIHNEYLETASFTDNDDSFKLANVPAREYYSTNNTTNFSAFVTSKLIQPINEDVNCGMKVWDRTVGGGNDNKYYRTFIPSSNPSINDIWESEMVVKFNKL